VLEHGLEGGGISGPCVGEVPARNLPARHVTLAHQAEHVFLEHRQRAARPVAGLGHDARQQGAPVGPRPRQAAAPEAAGGEEQVEMVERGKRRSEPVHQVARFHHRQVEAAPVVGDDERG